ncbi:hypothetical protein NEOLEDRAFT_1149446 [Neolentinus lepideus HHB14362 ss-1]|uniref:Uncharacterized protein n=1 Tax=Neolentinus lepideus HHB14362 ss-1 TaxID=1314782 RepID=A0A165R5G2_9AGAM|nr:hypothetical protein NEOLEDRAFT_1149446 [Neolentinus lepideus HHB14362 ss-1]
MSLEKVDILILGAGWSSTFLIPLCKEQQISYAATSRDGREGTIPFIFDPESDDATQFSSLPDANTVFSIRVSGGSESWVDRMMEWRCTYNPWHRRRPRDSRGPPQFDKATGQRWFLTDQRMYDWWDLASAWGSGGESSRGSDPTGPQAGWVRELMDEERVRALPRSPEQIGRALDSREFLRTFGLSPVRKNKAIDNVFLETIHLIFRRAYALTEILETPTKTGLWFLHKVIGTARHPSFGVDRARDAYTGASMSPKIWDKGEVNTTATKHDQTNYTERSSRSFRFYE